MKIEVIHHIVWYRETIGTIVIKNKIRHIKKLSG